MTLLKLIIIFANRSLSMKLLLAPIETINTNCPHGVSSYSNVGATRYNMGAIFLNERNR